MVQTIAPRDTGGLTGIETEQRHQAPVPPDPLGSDIHFDVTPNGAMPAGIAVEPSNLLFEATDGGFGDLFGEVPPLAADLQLNLLPVTQERIKQSPGALIDNQPAATVVTQVSPGVDDAGLPQTGQARVEETHSKLPPAARMPATFGGDLAPNGQSSGGEGSQKPTLRRANSRSDEGGLPDFGEAIRSRAPESAQADTSFSELAEATGLRRSTGPVGPETATHPGAPIRQHKSSKNHPVLIDGSAPPLWARLRWPIAVVLLLGMLATVGYFLGFQKLLGGGKSGPSQSANLRSGSNDAPETASAPGQPETAVKPPDTPAKPPEAAAAGETPAAIKEPEPSPAAAAPPVVVGDVQPTHSLQAASIPNEAGAKVFAEKLIRAGVPAYVVSVDIPRRGKWFRVRVGQFSSAGEATKYAAQARQRAKAAGINLDLIVCDYEKP